MISDDTSFGDKSLGLPNETWKWIGIGSMTMLLIFLYLPSLNATRFAWRNPQYSHGWLIPVIACILLWLRREPFEKMTIKQILIGGGIILFGALCSHEGSARLIETLARTSLIPCIIGVFVLFGGLRTLIWAAPAILFLIFMHPLPMFFESEVLGRLQIMAAWSSCFLLQLFGISDVYSEAYMLYVNGLPLEVANQCSGLRMLTIFMAFAMAFALLATNRPIWERVVLFISSVPIALFVNIFRITLTGFLFGMKVPSEIAHAIFHDMAGLIMMPLAIGLLYIEYQFLSHLVIEEPVESFTQPGFNIPPASDIQSEQPPAEQ